MPAHRKNTTISKAKLKFLQAKINKILDQHTLPSGKTYREALLEMGPEVARDLPPAF